MLPLRRAGRKRTSAHAHLPEQARELVLDRRRAGQPATSSDGASRRRRQLGTSAARQASSPCVKVVSMPLPE
jgi:hypothetical protein